MSAVTCETVTDLNSFTSLIQEHVSGSEGPLWYRGCSNVSHTLVPTLFRHPKTKKADESLKLEAEILTRFKLRCAPYLTASPKDDWDYFLLMQHFGVPTRLLDWTENPFIGLYFALSVCAAAASDEHPPETDAALWVLDTQLWNQHALRHMSYVGGPLSVLDNRLKGYAPRETYEEMPADPVAIYGTHNSPRVVAQRGAFTIFGKSNEPMERLYDQSGFPNRALSKILLPWDHLHEFTRSILAIGYTDSVLFPDLDGLAREIKRHYGFRI